MIEFKGKKLDNLTKQVFKIVPRFMAAILHLLILSVLCVYSPSNIESVPSSVGIMRDSSSFQHPILTVPEKFTKLFLYAHEISKTKFSKTKFYFIPTINTY